MKTRRFYNANNTRLRRAAAALLALALLLPAAGCAGRKSGVTPAEGAEVDFHTALQRAYLADPYVNGAVGTPDEMRVRGVTYVIDGNPYDSPDLDTRRRMHDDWSRPDPVTLAWEGESPEGWVVQLSTDAGFREDVRSFTTAEASLDVYNLYIGTRYYWRAAPSADGLGSADVHSFTTSPVGPRNLYIDGVTNVRDIGGYELADGSSRIRQGLLYRGARLNVSYMDDDSVLFIQDPDYFQLTVTEKGIDTLVNELGVRTELDVRVAGERNETGNMNDDRIEGLRYVSIPMDYQGGEATDNNLTRLDNPGQIRKVFELLADEDNYPVYFHCYIGTDRTGVIAWLLGALCGMDEEDLYVNYVFSNFGDIAGSTTTAGRQIGTITGEYGYGTLVDTYPGDTLAERTENALVDICGLSRETLRRVREILVEYD